MTVFEISKLAHEIGYKKFRIADYEKNVTIIDGVRLPEIENLIICDSPVKDYYPYSKLFHIYI